MQTKKNESKFILSSTINLSTAWKQTTAKHTNCHCFSINASISITIYNVQYAYWINTIHCYWLHGIIRFNGITLLFNLLYITYTCIEWVINWNEMNRWLNKKKLSIGIFKSDQIHLSKWSENGSTKEFYM